MHSTVRLAALLRTELLLAGADAPTRDAVNALVFSAEDTYAPGGPTFTRGLFAWEREALAHPAFPRGGRLLLGGAGGGRELVALAAMGYTVDAFEPAGALLAALAAQNFVLAITAQGGATCMMEGFDESRVRKLLKLSSSSRVVTVLGIGFEAPRGTWGPQFRLPLEQVVHIYD